MAQVAVIMEKVSQISKKLVNLHAKI